MIHRNLDIHNLYRKLEQIKTLGRLLGSIELAKNYIHDKQDDYFLSKGHMTANRDFFYGAQVGLDIAISFENFLMHCNDNDYI